MRRSVPSPTLPRSALALLAAGALAAASVAGCARDSAPAAGEPAAPPPERPAPGPGAGDLTVTAPAPAEDADAGTADAAVSVVVDYYTALADGDHARAHALWADGGAASGQSLEEFRRAHAGTETVSVEIGRPGRIEPAAGSRYVRVPVEIRTILADGSEECWRGSHVLRRAVVPGATPEQRRWHLDSADLEPCPADPAAPDAEEREGGLDEEAENGVAHEPDGDPDEGGATAATAVVERFGARMDRVSLLAPVESVREQIRSEYGPLVTAELLARWLADPTAAPGRQTSSPSPDRIEVAEVTPRAEGGWTVRGEIVLVTSVERATGGAADRRPVELTVVDGGGGWRIASWEWR